MNNTFCGAEESSVNHAFTKVDNKESLPKIEVNEELSVCKAQRLRWLDGCELLRQKIAIILGIIGFVTALMVISLIATGDNVKQTLIHNHPVLDYISQYRVQKAGKIPTTNGDVSAVDLSCTDKDGKGIAEVLYQSKRERTKRLILNTRRIRFILDIQASFPNANLIKFNMRHNKSLDTIQQKEEKAVYANLQSKYNLSAYKEELPICAVLRSYNNNAFMRIEYNLNSIFTQNYTNYMAVIINDASDDGSDIVYRKYLDFYNVPKERYVYIQNHQRKGALENTYNAIHQVCSNDSIVLVIDGDDELIGKNVFKLYNAFHQKYKGGWIYSNFYRIVLSDKVMQVGYSRAYDLQQKKSVSFRQDPIKCSHLRSFPANLFKKVPAQNFKDKQGNFYQVTQDIAIFLPVAELACGRVYWIPEVTYLYNGDTGLNDWKLRGAEQIAVEKEIRNKKRSQCLAEYKQMPLLT